MSSTTNQMFWSVEDYQSSFTLGEKMDTVSKALLASATSQDLADNGWRQWLENEIPEIERTLEKSKHTEMRHAVGLAEEARDRLLALPSAIADEPACIRLVRRLLDDEVANSCVGDHALWRTPEWGLVLTLPLTELWSFPEDVMRNLESRLEEGICVTNEQPGWQDMLVRSFFRSFFFVMVISARGDQPRQTTLFEKCQHALERHLNNDTLVFELGKLLIDICHEFQESLPDMVIKLLGKHEKRFIEVRARHVSDFLGRARFLREAFE